MKALMLLGKYLFPASLVAAFSWSSYCYAQVGPTEDWLVYSFGEKVVVAGFISFIFGALWLAGSVVVISPLTYVLTLPLKSVKENDKLDRLARDPLLSYNLEGAILISNPYLWVFLTSFYQMMLWGRCYPLLFMGDPWF